MCSGGHGRSSRGGGIDSSSEMNTLLEITDDRVVPSWPYVRRRSERGPCRRCSHMQGGIQKRHEWGKKLKYKGL